MGEFGETGYILPETKPASEEVQIQSVLRTIALSDGGIGYVDHSNELDAVVGDFGSKMKNVHLLAYGEIDNQKELLGSLGQDEFAFLQFDTLSEAHIQRLRELRRNGGTKANFLVMIPAESDVTKFVDEKYDIKLNSEGFELAHFKRVEKVPKNFLKEVLYILRDKKTYEWEKRGRSFFHQKGMNLMGVWRKGRERTALLSLGEDHGNTGFSEINKNRIYNDFYHLIGKKGWKDWLSEVREAQGRELTMMDVFSDPLMVRHSVEVGLASLGLAIGAGDWRSEEQKQSEAEKGVFYLPGERGGVWDGGLYGRLREFKAAHNELAENGGFDLIVGRPLRGWQMMRKAPYTTDDEVRAPFELQILVLRNLWEFLRPGGTMLFQLYETNKGDLKRYRDELRSAGFSSWAVIDEHAVIRIDKKPGDSQRLPKFRRQIPVEEMRDVREKAELVI